MTIGNYIILGLLTLYTLMVIASVYTILFERREPTRALIWIVVIVVIPVVGLFFFLFFGQSRRRRKLFNLSGLTYLRRVELFSQWQVKQIENLELEGTKDYTQTIKLLLQNSNTPLTTNNTIKILNNGEETFSAIFAAIDSAKHHIHIEYYTIEDDELGRELLHRLCSKAREGVEVRVLYDGVGSWSLPKGYRQTLKRAGIEVQVFQRVYFPLLTSSMNYRNHRKIVVVDGQTAFMGGLNFAIRYLRGTKRGVWRDTHLQIEGDAVQMLQVTFSTDWYAMTKCTIPRSSDYYPTAPQQPSPTACQITLSGPDSRYAAIMQAFFATISRAKKKIFISTPYFLPSESLLTALKVAALSGVDVKIMLPEYSDSKLVHWASRSYFTELLEAKVEVYLYKKGFNHSKIMAVDGSFSSIGSANMDPRSLEDNFEVTAMIYDSQIAEQLESSFLKDIEECRHITLKWWHERKRKDNFKEAAARLFSPML